MFGGTGTVAVVAAKTGRNFIHVDISKGYCKVAEKRLNSAKEKLSQAKLNIIMDEN